MIDIKTKQKVQIIKTKDFKANIKHFIKQNVFVNLNVNSQNYFIILTFSIINFDSK